MYLINQNWYILIVCSDCLSFYLKSIFLYQDPIQDTMLHLVI